MLNCNEVAVFDEQSPESSDVNGCSVDSIPVEPLLVMDGTLSGRCARILKDAGCNTNVLSTKFVQRNAEAFKTVRGNVTVNHSAEDRVQQATQVVLDGILEVGNHKYRYNFVVANCRHDVLLGMSWHVARDHNVSYPAREVQLKNGLILMSYKRRKTAEVAKVHNTSIKSVRRELRKMQTMRNDIKSFQLIEVSNADCSQDELKVDDARIKALMERYSDVFRTELPDGLPPKRSVDHAIETEPGAKPPHRSSYQLSHAELQAAKEYVVDLMKKGKIRPNRSLYGAPLFIVKDGDKPLRGVVDYRALNRITKRNNKTLPRSDEMFDRLEGTRAFSKLDLKTGFDQIRLRPEDIEKLLSTRSMGSLNIW
jgi:hypothetical protein